MSGPNSSRECKLRGKWGTAENNIADTTPAGTDGNEWHSQSGARAEAITILCCPHIPKPPSSLGGEFHNGWRRHAGPFRRRSHGLTGRALVHRGAGNVFRRQAAGSVETKKDAPTSLSARWGHRVGIGGDAMVKTPVKTGLIASTAGLLP